MNTLNNLLKEPCKPIINNLFANPQYIMASSLRTIYNIDYTTFYKKQKLFKKLQDFRNNYYDYEKSITNLTYFDLAVNTAKLQELELKNSNINVQVDSSYDIIKKTIEKIKVDIETIIEMCDSLMQIIDYSGRYHWEENKEKIAQKAFASMDNNSLEKYLLQDQESKSNDNNS